MAWRSGFSQAGSGLPEVKLVKSGIVRGMDGWIQLVLGLSPMLNSD